MQNMMLHDLNVSNPTQSNVRDHVAYLLLKEKAVTVNPGNLIQFASGILSPVYVDNRRLISCPEVRRIIVDYFIMTINQIGDSGFDVIAGTATGGIPWAAWIAERLSLPMIYVREAPKDRGLKRHVEGILKNAQRAILVEDLITTGLSASSRTHAIRDMGGIVNDCVAIFSFEAPISFKLFGEDNVRPWALTNLRTLLTVGEAEGLLSIQDVKSVDRWASMTLASFQMG